jgi:hypothetical protein
MRVFETEDQELAQRSAVNHGSGLQGLREELANGIRRFKGRVDVRPDFVFFIHPLEPNI